MRHAIRSLLRTPGFTAVALLTLAIGIGAITTVFSWIDRVLLTPLPGVSEPHRIVALETRTPQGDLIDTSYPDFIDYQGQAKSFSYLLVHKERPLTLGTGSESERVWSELVSGNFFEALGVRPRLGRFFARDDRADTPAATPVVVISESLWRRRFHSDPGILGRIVKLNQRDFTVIGVAPATFLGVLNGLAFDAWVPLNAHAHLLGPSRWLESRGSRSLHTLGRLAPGASLQSARAELAAISARLAIAQPERLKGLGLVAMPVTDSPHGAHRDLAKPLLLLLGVSGLLLLIVCANLSNLLLVRASARQREMCIRQALGAGTWRLLRQLLAESLVLSSAGALLGLLVTWWLSGLLTHILPDATLPISLTADLSGRVLLLAVAISTVTALLAGLAPALWVTRPSLIDALRSHSRAASALPQAEFFRRGLVVVQVAVALVTLASAALAVKSFVSVKRANPGFDSSGVLLATLKLDTSGYTRADATAFLERLQQRLPSLSGTAAAALAEDVPLGLHKGSWEEISVPGYARKPQEDLRIYRNFVSPGYFSLMRIPLLSGREFDAADTSGAPFVAIVNETFARRYFGTAEALGRTFSVWGSRTLTVVGVARDVKVSSIGEPARPYFYVSLPQFYSLGTGLAIHLRVSGDGDPMLQLPALRALVRELDPNVPLFEAVALADYVSAARYVQKAAASLLGVLSALAVALTALGLYGTLAFVVAQRTPEFGVRLALGAQASDITRLVLGRGALLVGLGLFLGLVAAAAATRVLASLLYGLDSVEPTLLAVAVLPLLLAAFAACYLPARRAARIDPLSALRAE